VLAARARQEQRARRLGVTSTNARLIPAELERAAPLDETTRSLLAAAVAKFSLSARAYHRAWRLARTVADLAGEDAIGAGAVAEALSMRGER
jgi:magnesium chelatase family protein